MSYVEVPNISLIPGMFRVFRIGQIAGNLEKLFNLRSFFDN